MVKRQKRSVFPHEGEPLLRSETVINGRYEYDNERAGVIMNNSETDISLPLYSTKLI
jgi:hypothetical protein